MRKFVSRFVKTGFYSFVILSTGLMFLLISFAGILWFSGLLSTERIEAAYQGFKMMEDKEKEAPEDVAKEEWERIQTTRRQQEENFQLRKSELESLRQVSEARMQQIKFEQAQLDEKDKTLKSDQAAFEARKKAFDDAKADTTFRDNVRKYEDTAPKTVVVVLKDLSNDEIVRYLRAMRSDVVADLLKVMATDADMTTKPDVDMPSRLAEITKLMQSR